MPDLTKPFALTPETGERLARASDLSRAANLDQPLFGHGVMETSLGRNLGFALMSARLAQATRALQGPAALDAEFEMDGVSGVLPAGTTVYLGGVALTLTREEFDFAGLPTGTHWVVIEAWRAPVGPTTLGRATQPEIYVGVTDTVNKPDAAHLFPAGNVDRVTGGPSDEDLVTATVQTQKFVQWQYRLRVVPGGLSGYASDLIPLMPEVPGVPDSPQVRAGAYVSVDGPLYRATIAPEAGAYPRALDRTLWAAGLARVVVSASGIDVRHSRLDAPIEDLAFVAKPRPAHHVEEAAVRQELLGRIRALERRGAYAEYTNDEVLAVQDLSAGGLSTDQRLPLLPPLTSGDMGVTYDPARISRVTVTRAARLRVTASLTFLAGSTSSGAGTISLLRNGSPTGFASSCAFASANVALNLSAEVSVGAGDVLEIGVSQTSGSLLTVASGARVTVTAL